MTHDSQLTPRKRFLNNIAKKGERRVKTSLRYYKRGKQEDPIVGPETKHHSGKNIGANQKNSAKNTINLETEPKSIGRRSYSDGMT